MGKRALLIGLTYKREGEKYLDSSLNDVNLMGNVLKDKGYHVLILNDEEKDIGSFELKRSIRKYFEKGKGNFILYFSGHGQDEGLLLNNNSFLHIETLFSLLSEGEESSLSYISYVILDCCYIQATNLKWNYGKGEVRKEITSYPESNNLVLITTEVSQITKSYRVDAKNYGFLTFSFANLLSKHTMVNSGELWEEFFRELQKIGSLDRPKITSGKFYPNFYF